MKKQDVSTTQNTTEFVSPDNNTETTDEICEDPQTSTGSTLFLKLFIKINILSLTKVSHGFFLFKLLLT